MTPVLSVRGLVKHYGRVQAANNISFDLFPGQVCGILGPNGSGKTTTLSIIMGNVAPQAGEFSWNIMGKKNDFPNLHIGALIESPNFYPYLSLYRNLQIIATIKGLDYSDINRVLNITGLEERSSSKYQTLSLGMKQRLGLAATLLGDPEVLVLDEPANGLDPEGIADIRRIILDEADKGKTILMASHILDEVEKVCSHVVVLKEGHVIGSGPVHELLEPYDLISVRCASLEKMVKLAEELPGVHNHKVENGTITLRVDESLDPGKINMLAHENGIILTHLEKRKPTLEAQFLALVREENQGND